MSFQTLSLQQIQLQYNLKVLLIKFLQSKLCNLYWWKLCKVIPRFTVFKIYKRKTHGLHKQNSIFSQLYQMSESPSSISDSIIRFKVIRAFSNFSNKKFMTLLIFTIRIQDLLVINQRLLFQNLAVKYHHDQHFQFELNNIYYKSSWADPRVN